MAQRYTRLYLLFVCLMLACSVYAQQADRIQLLQQKLEKLAVSVPGLNDPVQLSISSVTIQDFLNALSRSNGLSISVDPKLNFKVNNNFNNVSALNILVFLARQHNLEITPVGSILQVSPYVDPASFRPVPVKEISARYQQLANTLSLELNSDTLTAVARRITQVSGKNVVVPVSLQGKRVTAYINNAPFDEALEKLAFANELKLQKTSDNFYLFQPLEEGEQLYINGDRNTAVRKTYKPATGAAATGGHAGINVRTVAGGQKLISADATGASILDLVKSASLETGKNYFLYSDLKGTLSMHVADVTYESFLTALFKGTEYTFTVDNGIYLIGERKLEGLRVNKVIQLQNRAIDTVLAMIPNEWKRGVEIKEFREQNTLLLSGSRPQIAEIESLVKQIDLLVPMVLIEVTLLDIRKNRTTSTGLKAGIADSVKTGGTILPGIDYTFGSRSINDFLNKVGKITSTNLGPVTPNFYATLTALESSDNVEVRSVPKLSTLNGHPALFSIGEKRYYEIRTQNVIPSVTNSTNIFTNQFKEVEANLEIGVTPIVSGDDQVTLKIRVDISSFIGIPSNNAPPPTSNSKFESILRVHTDDMIVLGGIERNENSENSSGIPLLSRIPILKYLFSSRNKTKGKVVTVVFIKPTIIR
jgi:type IV pilus assembly protein PilQ